MNAIAGLGAAEFLSGMQGLLPPGDAMTIDPNADLTDLLAGLVGRQVDVHANAALLSEVESDPRQTVYLLPDWEASFGLPDTCQGDTPTISQRQAQLVARIAGRGGQSGGYMINFAATLGFVITITTFTPFTFGQNFGQLMYGAAWAYLWQVNAAAGATDAVLQCELQRIAPAHLQLSFNLT